MRSDDGGEESDTAAGWGEWSEAVEESVGSSSFDTDVGDAVGNEVEAGDAIRFTEPPDPRIDTTTFEVDRVDEFGRRDEVHLSDDQGHFISFEVKNERDFGATGELKGAVASVDGIAKGGVDDSSGTPTVDEYRDELTADSWDETVDQFASEANRAYYKMYLQYENNGTKEPIKDGYSSTTAAEVPSQMHELFQTQSETDAERSTEVAEAYPRLTAAYLEMFEPAEPVKDKLSDVDGVSI